jgi:hypothetical protein
MGQSTDAILFYGFDLGDPDSDEVAETYKETMERAGRDANDEDIEFEHAVAFLAGLVGPRPDYHDGRDAWHDWGTTATAAFNDAFGGVTEVVHCSGEYPMYGIGLNVQGASRGSVVRPDLTLPAPEAVERIREVMRILGLEVPPATEATWCLVSYWG